jgi:DDE family transposase
MLTHPAPALLSDNFSRNDLFTTVFCIVDDWMKESFGQSNAPRKGRGPRQDEFADSEVLTVLLVGELCHCLRERAWLRQVRASYRHLFPRLPEDSRFARRAERVRELLRHLRHAILFWADVDCEPLRILDSFPMPLCACYRIRQSSQPITGATFGYNASKREFFFGLHPGLLLTGSGYIEDLFLAPGNCNDTPLLAFYLDECIEQGRDLSGQEWYMDKGFLNQELKRRANQMLGVHLVARARQKKGEEATFWQALQDKIRKPIEGVLSVLTECLGIEHLLVKTDIGIYRRTQAKATAFSLGRYLNQVLGAAIEPMNIARYAV